MRMLETMQDNLLQMLQVQITVHSDVWMSTAEWWSDALYEYGVMKQSVYFICYLWLCKGFCQWDQTLVPSEDFVDVIVKQAHHAWNSMVVFCLYVSGWALITVTELNFIIISVWAILCFHDAVEIKNWNGGVRPTHVKK